MVEGTLTAALIQDVETRAGNHGRGRHLLLLNLKTKFFNTALSFVPSPPLPQIIQAI